MGGPSSPRVFQTTPPQPASKARRTLYSLSVGGAEASQNGFGLLMPTKSVVRSAISAPPGSGARQRGVNIFCGIAAFGDGRHGQVVSADGAIAPGPDTGDRGTPWTCDRDFAALQIGQVVSDQRLPDRLEDLVGRQAECLARRFKRIVGEFELDLADPPVAMHRDG